VLTFFLGGEEGRRRRSHRHAKLAMLSCCQTKLNTEGKLSGKDEIFENLEEKKQ
jgi:hypothetical protein